MCCVWLSALGGAQAQLYLNEILFNPPGADTPNEYIELRASPHYIIPAGTYLLGIEGNAGGEPGTVQNVFDLSGRMVSGNGLLVLLQKNHPYAPAANAFVLVNSGTGPGWGSGSSSSIGHRGEDGQTEIENASVTFLLIRAPVYPSIGTDIDANNDGTPDGAYSTWIVLDSIGVLDADGAGDFAYGAINFRRNTAPGNGAMGTGVIVPIGFTPSYLGRSGNTTGSGAADWVASNNLEGAAPNWTLDSSETVPAVFAGRALNHLGLPNFGAANFHAVVIKPTGGSTDVIEGGSTDTYNISLNTTPAGAVTIQLTATGQARISIDGGGSFGGSRALTFTSTASQTVTVRAVDDNTVDTSPHPAPIRHVITSTADTARYPVSTFIPPMVVNVIENDGVVLNELKVNPPGTDDPYEYIELRGTPNARLTNTYLLVLEGNATKDPGTANVVIDLTGAQLGSAGLLLIVADGHPYVIPSGCAVWLDAQLNNPGGALDNHSVSFLLTTMPTPVQVGQDLDGGDNGVLEELPAGTTVLDAVGWGDGDTNDVIFGGVVLSNESRTPDAAVRFSGNLTPNSAAAWYAGELAGSDPLTVVFDEEKVSSNFPAGTPLSPGTLNNTAPSISAMTPLCGAIGDPTNPSVTFTIADAETPVENLVLSITSTNPFVVPDSNLMLTGSGATRTLSLDPIGVGYSAILIRVSDGAITGQGVLLYAASERGRPDTRYHSGVSDASTALTIDTDYMWVGDDENQVIRIYSRRFSGPPVAGFDFTPFLGLTDIENGVPREVDIEASVRTGNRIYWIGAHSHANIAESRTNRSRLFATELSGTGAAATLSYLGRYDYLKLDLVNWDEANGHGKGAGYYGLAESTAEGVNPKAPDGSGFNIEGLTLAPGSTEIGYVAFRAPLASAALRTHALIVPVLNFGTLAAGTGPPGSAVFGQPIELDLYGRGIRSIERRSTNYLIIAGPPGDFVGNFPTNFCLYTWSGNPADPPQARAADLTDLNPEGIVELPLPPWNQQTLIHLLSDCGRRIWYNDGIAAKLLPIKPFKKFRTDIVALGPVFKPVPIITGASLSEEGVTVYWRALKDEGYRLQYKNHLGAPGWTDIPGDVVASGPFAEKTDSSGKGQQRFYQVMILP